MQSALQILDLITDRYADLTPRLQQAASHIVRAPEDVAIRTMRDLAGEIDVPASTLVRLAKALDFESYEAFRTPFKEALRQRGELFSDRAQWLQQLASQNESGKIISKVAGAAISNLEYTFTNISAADIEKAAKTMINAQKVYVTGIGAMKHTNGFFCSLARMAIPNVMWADPVGGGEFDDLAGIAKNDVLFISAFSPCARASVESVEVARSRGATVIALSDSPVSPVVLDADIALIIPTESPQFFPSQTAVLCVLESLIAMIVAHAGQPAIEQIERVVDYRYKQNLYWSNK